MGKDKRENQNLVRGSSNTTADLAVEPDYSRESFDPEAPPSRPAQPVEGRHDQLGEKVDKAENRQEALLDEAVEETFPGSDPISPSHVD